MTSDGPPPAPGPQPSPGSQPSPGFQQAPGNQQVPGSQPSPGPQHAPGYPPSPGYPAAPGYQAAPGYFPQPVAMNPQDERTWAMLSHLAPFLGGLVGLPFLGPLVVFLIYKDRSPFVRGQSLESLNFQLTLLIGYVIGLILLLALVGIFVIIGLAVASIVLQIIGAVTANRGEAYRYPLTIRFVK